MKKVIVNVVRTILVFSLLIPMFVDPLSVYAKDAENIKDLKSELAALKQEKIDNQRAKSQTQSEINSKKEAIASAYEEQEQIALKVVEAENKISDSNDKIVKKTEETNELIRFLQMIDGENTYLEYISGAQSTSDLVERVAIVEQITDYNEEVVAEMEALIKENEDLKIELSNRNIELETAKVANAKAISSLGNKLSELNEINEDIDSQIKNQKALIEYYEGVCTSDTQNLSECVSLAYSAQFIRPVVKGSITSPWGYRVDPLTGKKNSFHNAIDIGGNSVGTPVYAAAAGLVAAITKKSSCGGNIIYIHHNVKGKYYTTQYAHLYTVNVKVGDKVTVNTQIGSVGGKNSYTPWDKCSTGAHLHFGISTGRYLGADYSSWSKFIANSVNPMNYIPSGNRWSSRY